MPGWDAFLTAMRSVRRIDRRQAERLLARQPTDPGHAGVAALLAAAAAPPRPEELAGEAGVVAAFAAARRDGSAETAPAHPLRGRLRWGGERVKRSGARGQAAPLRGRLRRDGSAETAPAHPLRGRHRWWDLAVVKFAAIGAALLVGGAAVAAETGSLPEAMQQRMHDLFGGLGVPPAGGHSDDRAGGAASTPAPTSAPGPPTPTAAGVAELCRAWEAFRRDPRGRPMRADDLRALATAAGGEQRVAAFCARTQRSAPGDPAPGRGNENDPGNGNGPPGNGNGPPGNGNDPPGNGNGPPGNGNGPPGNRNGNGAPGNGDGAGDGAGDGPGNGPGNGPPRDGGRQGNGPGHG